MMARDGVAAVSHIGARVMTTSDKSVAALSSWYNEPTPITKAQAVSNALVEWLRDIDQLTSEGAAPSVIQQRISLQQLMSKVPEVLRAFEALEAIHDDVSVDDMVKAVRRIGNKHSSVASQKRAIAMMVGANSVGGKTRQAVPMLRILRIQVQWLLPRINARRWDGASFIGIVLLVPCLPYGQNCLSLWCFGGRTKAGER